MKTPTPSDKSFRERMGLRPFEDLDLREIIEAKRLKDIEDGKKNVDKNGNPVMVVGVPNDL